MDFKSTSRRDDLISIFYMLVNLLNETRLPFKDEKLYKMIFNPSTDDDELYFQFKEVKEFTSL
jgi:hypothetical protein